MKLSLDSYTSRQQNTSPTDNQQITPHQRGTEPTQYTTQPTVTTPHHTTLHHTRAARGRLSTPLRRLSPHHTTLHQGGSGPAQYTTQPTVTTQHHTTPGRLGAGSGASSVVTDRSVQATQGRETPRPGSERRRCRHRTAAAAGRRTPSREQQVDVWAEQAGHRPDRPPRAGRP